MVTVTLRVAGGCKPRTSDPPRPPTALPPLLRCDPGAKAKGTIMAGLVKEIRDNPEKARAHLPVSMHAAATLLGAQYDTGQMNVVERSSGHAVLEWVGFALPAREICGTLTGYQAERMTLSRLEEVRVKHVVCRADGGATCRWELDWKSRRGG
jgi:hypothetical protein